VSKPFSKSDLEMITEIYKMMDKNVKWKVHYSIYTRPNKLIFGEDKL
jgi:hypothetical protein